MTSEAPVYRAVIETRFRGYQAGQRQYVYMVPVVLAGGSVSVLAATEWGHAWLRFPLWTYVIASVAFAAAIFFAIDSYKRFDALSRRCRLAERVETFVTTAFETLIVFSPGHVLHWGWLVFVVHVVMHVPLRKIYPRASPLVVVVLACVSMGFAWRDGLAAGGIAVLLSLGCLIVMYALIALDEQNIQLEVARQRALQALADAQVELERNRIAQSLHDGISGRLIALLWHVRGLGETLSREQRMHLEARIGACVADLRGAVWTVEGSEQTGAEWAERLRAQVEALGDARLQIRIDPAFEQQILDPTAAALLLNAGTELAYNAVRHSDATRIEILVGPALRVCVSDDGKGMPEALPKGGGLARLERQLTARGGRIELAPREPRGTSVSITLSASTSA